MASADSSLQCELHQVPHLLSSNVQAVGRRVGQEAIRDGDRVGIVSRTGVVSVLRGCFSAATGRSYTEYCEDGEHQRNPHDLSRAAAVDQKQEP